MLSTSSSGLMTDVSAFFPDTLSPILLWIIFAIAFVVWVTLAGILWYHWNTYDSDSPRIKRVKRIFVIGSVIILLLAVTFIFSL